MLSLGDDPTVPCFFDSPGKCIFCRLAKPNLTKEHIVPESIGGKLVYRGATCDDCKLLWETTDLVNARYHFGDGRLQLKVKGKKNPHRIDPTHVGIGINNGDNLSAIEAAEAGYPANIMLPVLFAPGMLQENYKVGTGKIVRLHHSSLNPENRAFQISRVGKGSIQYRQRFNYTYFQNYIMKIAHCYATAKLGFYGFDPYLQRWQTTDNRGSKDYLVGGALNIEPNEGQLHSLNILKFLVDNRKIVGVRVRLFSNQGMPTYIALVGEVHI